MNIFLFLNLIVLVIWFLYALKRIERALHYFQLEEYDNLRFLRWTLKNSKRLFTPFEIAVWFTALALYIVFLTLRTTLPGGYLPSYLLLVITGILLYIKFPKHKAKKPLVFTPRVRRLFNATCGISLLIMLSSQVLWAKNEADFDVFRLAAINILQIAIAVAGSFIIIISNIVMAPVEASVRRYFIRKAQEKLEIFHPIVIGITGSYGKTSTKTILAQLLSLKHNVYATPGSFNTPMGLCRAINEDLQEEHEFFIAEMGAYKPGEIKKLCNLTHPEAGIITIIGIQHLERFGTVDNIAKAKYELIQALPAHGLAVFNRDNPRCRSLAEKTQGIKVKTYSMVGDSEADIYASNIATSSKGLEFDIQEGASSKKKVHISTRLLGKHNIGNILAAAVIARNYGFTLEEISLAAERLKPAQHRLELIEGAGGVQIIDDAYNSNPEGISTALEVLSEFPAGQKILITPGLIELGEKEEEENQKVGIKAAKSCDWAILVAPPRAEIIANAMKVYSFPEDHIFIVNNLEEATKKLQGIVKPGDVVLFANDLPDTYER